MRAVALRRHPTRLHAVAATATLHRRTRLQDGEVRKVFQRALQKQGMKFMLGTKVRRAPR